MQKILNVALFIKTSLMILKEVLQLLRLPKTTILRGRQFIELKKIPLLQFSKYLCCILNVLVVTYLALHLKKEYFRDNYFMKLINFIFFQHIFIHGIIKCEYLILPLLYKKGGWFICIKRFVNGL